MARIVNNEIGPEHVQRFRMIDQALCDHVLGLLVCALGPGAAGGWIVTLKLGLELELRAVLISGTSGSKAPLLRLVLGVPMRPPGNTQLPSMSL